MVPAYNEEKYLTKTLERYDKTVKTVFNNYEFIIFNDGSSDKTGKIADGLAKKNKKIRVIHNKKNMGMGYNYREGIKLSQKDYYMFLGAKGDVLESSVKEVINQIGEADILIPYVGNPEVRPLFRAILSRAFTISLNTLFGLKLKYYNGIVVHKTEILRKIKMRTNNVAYQAEILIRMLKKGYSYKEIPFYVRRTNGHNTLRIKNLSGVFLTILRLFFEINIKR